MLQNHIWLVFMLRFEAFQHSKRMQKVWMDHHLPWPKKRGTMSGPIKLGLGESSIPAWASKDTPPHCTFQVDTG